MQPLKEGCDRLNSILELVAAFVINSYKVRMAGKRSFAALLPCIPVRPSPPVQWLPRNPGLSRTESNGPCGDVAASPVGCPTRLRFYHLALLPSIVSGNSTWYHAAWQFGYLLSTPKLGGLANGEPENGNTKLNPRETRCPTGTGSRRFSALVLVKGRAAGIAPTCSLSGRACMAAAISLAKTWNGKLGNGILLQESRTACDCPYLLLTLGSLSVNRRTGTPVLFSPILAGR